MTTLIHADKDSGGSNRTLIEGSRRQFTSRGKTGERCGEWRPGPKQADVARRWKGQYHFNYGEFELSDMTILFE